MPILKVKHNGEWINVGGGGTSGGSNVNIDPTLTQSGSAADAKASGDAIRNLNTLVGNKPVAEQIQDAIDNLGGGGGEGIAVQANWDQNDSTQLDYIKNRTHYDAGDFIEVELLPAEDLSFEHNPSYGYVTFFSLVPPLKLGQQYLVIIDGERYIETAVTNEIMGGISLGESIMKFFLSLEAGMPVTYSKPFIIMQKEDSNEIMMIMLQSSESIHNVSISLTGQYLHKELYKVSNEKFDYMNGQYGKYLWDFSDEIVVGLDYKVIWDSTEYICKATALDPEETYIIIGNASMMGGEDTGEPFAFMVVAGMLSAFMDLENIYTPETNKSVSITIDKQLEDGSYENLITVTDFTLVYNDNMSVYKNETELEGVLETNSTYKITYAGNEYICSSLDIEGTVGLGNPSIIPEIAILGNTGEPFLMGYNPDSGIFVYESIQAPEVSHSIEFSGYVSGVKKLDKKYLPDNFDIPVASQNKVGGVKVRDARSGLGSGSDYTPIYLDTNDNQIYAKKPDIPVIQKSTTDLTEGVSSLASGTIYLVYE